MARVLEALGVEPPFASELRLVPALVSSAGGVSMLMAFGFLGRRRRDGLPSAPDAVLEASAARGIEAPAGADLVPAHGDAPMADQESLMPRWRRPSLLDARRSDPSRSVEPLVLMSFASGSVAPVEGLERRYIRYTVVELLDAPDELRAGSVGNLRQGDEVQLLGRSGLYWQVLCPDGRQGWIHRTTLGDVVGDLPAPTAEETWATDSLVDRDVDGEILAAFLASRVRG